LVGSGIASTFSGHWLTRDNLELKTEKIPSLSPGPGKVTNNKRAI